MRELRVDGKVVGTAEVADTMLTRARGLLFRRDLPEALVLRPCSSVHAAWMSRRLDVALLSDQGRVLHAQELRPWTASAIRRGVREVLEAPAGSFERWGLREGSRVEVAG